MTDRSRSFVVSSAVAVGVVLCGVVLLSLAGPATALRAVHMQHAQAQAQAQRNAQTEGETVIAETDELNAAAAAVQAVREARMKTGMHSMRLRDSISAPKKPKAGGKAKAKATAKIPKTKLPSGIKKKPTKTKKPKSPVLQKKAAKKGPKGVTGPADNKRRAWRKGEKEKTWKNGKKIPGANSKAYRKDKAGNLIKYSEYGKRTGPKAGQHPMGWEIDHKKPLAGGGTNEAHNLHPLQSNLNASKNDKYPYNYKAPGNIKGQAPVSHPNLDVHNSPLVASKQLFVNPENGSLEGPMAGHASITQKANGKISKKSPAVVNGQIKLKFL